MTHIYVAIKRFGTWKSIVLPGLLVLTVGLGIRAGAAQALSRDRISQGTDLQFASAAVPVGLGAGELSVTSALDASAASSPIMAIPPPLPAKKATRGRVLPFSRIAIATSTGTLGLGGQIATPLASWVNLRGGFDLISFGYGFAQSGVNHAGSMQLRSGSVSLDLFPFRSGFHISPGFLIFKSSAGGSLSVPGGDSFSMGDATLTSSAANPVTGSENLVFSRSIMPSLTIGFSNMIARKGSHWSVPLELGAAYTGHYSAEIGLQGSVCYKGHCGPTSNPTVKASVVQQQNSLDETMKRYQMFPIVMSGVSYRF